MSKGAIGKVAKFAAEARNMLLDRLAEQPGEARRSRKGDRQAVLAKPLAHRMRRIVHLFADPIFAAIEQRLRLQRVAGDVELAPEFGALDHRPARCVDEAGSGWLHQSSPRASKSSRNAALTSSKRIRVRQAAK